MTEQVKSLAERVDWLFRNKTKPDGSEYTFHEAEEGTARVGHRVTSTGIWKIRRGDTQNPGYLALRSLARFFGVPIDYFYDDNLNEEALQRYQMAASFQREGVAQIALRASQLDDEVQQTILAMIEHIAVPRRVDAAKSMPRDTSGRQGSDAENTE